MKELIKTFNIMLEDINSPTELVEFCKLALVQSEALLEDDMFQIDENQLLNYYIY